MTKASDNDYPSVLITEGTPATPAASHQRIGIDSSSHMLVTVNSSGGVTKYGIAHGARAKRITSNFSIGNNTYTAVDFNSEDYDTDTIHDNSTNPSRLTIPTITGVTTGLWSVKASGYITGGTQVLLEFRLNGTTIIGFSGNNDGVVGTFTGTIDYVFSAADYVELLLKCPTGTASAVMDAGLSPLFEVAFLGKVT